MQSTNHNIFSVVYNDHRDSRLGKEQNMIVWKQFISQSNIANLTEILNLGKKYNNSKK